MTFICIVLPDGYSFFEVSHQVVQGGWLFPRSRSIAVVNQFPYKPHRVAVSHTVSPELLIMRYARRRGLVDVHVQALNPLGIQL